MKSLVRGKEGDIEEELFRSERLLRGSQEQHVGVQAVVAPFCDVLLEGTKCNQRCVM